MTYAARMALAIALPALTLVGAIDPALADDASHYPAAGRTLRLITPHGAGSGADILSRLIAPKLSERWKVTAVTDNRTGASGDIGITAAAGAEPDGYTLLCVATVYTINPYMKKNPPYDPEKSFAPVSLLATSVLSLLTAPSLPAKTFPDFIELAHKEPGKMNYASSGIGSPQFVTMELLKLEAKINLVHVPYKDAPSMFRGMLTGEVQAQIQPLQTASPHIKNGNARMLAVMSAERAPAFPDVPTMRDLGYPNFVVETWYGIFAPAAMPKNLVTKINGDITAILDTTDMKQRLDKLGADAAPQSPEDFAKFVRAEVEKWAKVVKESGATVN